MKLKKKFISPWDQAAVIGALILSTCPVGGEKERGCVASRERKPNPAGLSLGSVQSMGAGQRSTREIHDENATSIY